MGGMPQPKGKDWLNGYKDKTPIYAVYKRPTAGVPPRWIQGIRRVDGVGVERLVY